MPSVDRTLIWLLCASTLGPGCGLVADAAPPRRDAGASDARGAFDAPGLDASGLDAPGLDAPGLDAAEQDGGDDEDDVGSADPCSGLPVGAGCSTPGAPRRICVEGACLPSWCGDGFVDREGGETCEPTFEPNCDAIVCRLGCEANADCTAGGPCQIGTCDGGLCRYDARPDLSRCPAGSCRAGTCVPETCGNGIVDPGEDCDSGTLSSAVCVGCQFECDVDSDCDDGDPCTSGARCLTFGSGEVTAYRLCARGIVTSCDPPISPCDISLCDGAGGCLVVPAVDRDGDGFSGLGDCPTRDCDDENPRIHPGRPEVCNGVDDDCDRLVDEGARAIPYCLDRDGDGYGDPRTATVPTCAAPTPRHVADCSDCWDSGDPLRTREAALVNPGQTGFFASPYCVVPGTCSFDYDCNELETPQTTVVEDCALLSLARCERGAGWLREPPACGVEGRYARCERALLLCGASVVTRRQACR